MNRKKDSMMTILKKLRLIDILMNIYEYKCGYIA